MGVARADDSRLITMRWVARRDSLHAGKKIAAGRYDSVLDVHEATRGSFVDRKVSMQIIRPQLHFGHFRSYTPASR